MKTKDVDHRPNKKLSKFRSHRRRVRSRGKRRRKLKGKVFNNWNRQPLKRKSFPTPMRVTMSGNCFWLNYASVFQWKDRHLSDASISAYTLPGMDYCQPSTSYQPYNESIANSRKTTVTTSRLTPTVNDFAHYEEPYEDLEESDDDIVVTEEMMQFLEISMRHKANLQIEKEEARKRREKELKDERDAIDSCQQPVEEAENEKRLTEMSQLYGKQAPMIHGMETALQLSFNRQVDIFNPPFWPILPFTIQFQSHKTS